MLYSFPNRCYIEILTTNLGVNCLETSSSLIVQEYEKWVFVIHLMDNRSITGLGDQLYL